MAEINPNGREQGPAPAQPAAEDLVRALQDYFVGNPGAYALQQPPVNGKCSYSAIYKPLTGELLGKHVEGGCTIGAYLLDSDAKTRTTVEDIDRRDDAGRETARALKRRFEHYGIGSLLEDSGAKGYHVWQFYAERIPAVKLKAIVKRICDEVVSELGCEPPELFPKQKKAKKVGSLIKLPWGKHQLTGNRTYFLDDNFKPLPDSGLQAVKDIPKPCEAAVDDILALMELEPEEDLEFGAVVKKLDLKEMPPCVAGCCADVKPGGRHDALFLLASYHHQVGTDPDVILEQLQDANRNYSPPMNDEDDIKAIAKDAKDCVCRCNFVWSRPALEEFCPGSDMCPVVGFHRAKFFYKLDWRFYFEKDGCFMVREPGSKGLWRTRTITSFLIEPQFRIGNEKGKEILQARLVAGENHYAAFLEKNQFDSKAKMLASIPTVDMQYFGNDGDTQAILAMITKTPLPQRKGTSILGLNEDASLWITRDGVLSADGFLVNPPLLYIPTEVDFDRRIHLPVVSNERNVVERFLPLIMRINALKATIVVVGWFSAAPLAPRLRSLLRHFPHLAVVGTQGSGKSSQLDFLWRLFCGVDSKLFSSSETRFTLLRLLSSTGSIPIVMDECKPYNMHEADVKQLVRYLKRGYDGEVEYRGRPDLSLECYRLLAPIAIAGETSPIVQDSALSERLLQVSLNPNDIKKGTPYYSNFRALDRADGKGFAAAYIKWCLKADAEALLKKADALIQKGMDDVPTRILDNLRIMVSGMVSLSGFAQSHGVRLDLRPDDVSETCQAMVQEVLGGKQPRVAFDNLLETMATMAQVGRLRRGIHYVTETQTVLYFHLADCLAEFRRFVKETNANVEVLDKGAYLKQAHEIKARNGSVKDAAALHWFPHFSEDGAVKGKTRRCIKVDLLSLEFDTSGFEEAE